MGEGRDGKWEKGAEQPGGGPMITESEGPVRYLPGSEHSD